MKRHLLIILLLLIAFTSCKVGRKYTRPDLKLPETLDTLTTVVGISFDSIRWFDIYQDEVLQQLIRQALDNNKDVLIAAARIKEARASRRITKADLYPKVDIALSADREYDSSPDHTFMARGMLSWEVDLWGKLRWADQAALASYLQTETGARALKIALISQVAEAYFELIAMDGELEIVKQTLAAREESVHLIRLRFEGGITSETVLRQAEVELAKTVNLIPNLELRIKLKENELALLIGQYPGEIPRGRNIYKQNMPDTIPVGLPSELLERRPDILQAEYVLKEAHANVGIAFTSLFPKITLTAQYGRESTDLSDLLKSPYFYLGGELLAPLLNMGKNRARLKAQRAALEGATHAYEKVVLTAFKEVSDALYAVRKTKEIKESYSNLESSANLYLELAKLQYINGVIGYIDVLDAQRVYFDAQVGYNNALEEELLGKVYLYKVLGGG
ncbi:TolC family protein [Odoribacter sp. OttesenSCG-928-J03]|nr:TolC family protein [Odoribacter sp. OttesenSCG-928-J03]MDL2283163.1 TolC family protein [Odoribacter sp. OttesenSCG-928-G04]MDL2331207.1 TolC family protein [Odoribacter sp. OttesenSCG-928-A06]